MLKNLKSFCCMGVLIGSFTLMACEGNVESNEVISACKNETGVDCSDCCKSNGFDSGSYSSVDNQCTCINLND